MSPHARNSYFGSGAWFAVGLCVAAGFVVAAASALPAQGQQTAQSDGNTMGGMAHMADHMHLTELRAMQTGDRQKADAIVEAALKAMEPYKD